MFSVTNIKKTLEDAEFTKDIEWYITKKFPIFDFLRQVYNERHQFTHICSENDLLKIINTLINFKIIARIRICKYLHKDTYIDTTPTYLYLLTDQQDSVLYFAIERVVPSLWYQINDINMLINTMTTINNIYDPIDYIQPLTIKKRYYFNKKETDFNLSDNVHDQFILNNFTEIMLYGSKWDDHPARKYMEKNIIGTREFNKIYLHAMQQNNDTYSITTRTIYSKSKIKFEESQGICILEISYNPITIPTLFVCKDKNKILSDIPIDLFCILSSFDNLIRFQDVINNVNILDSNTVQLTINLVIGNKDDEQELVNIFQQKESTEDAKYLIDDFCIHVITKTHLHNMLNDSDFISQVKKFIEKHKHCDNILEKLTNMIFKLFFKDKIQNTQITNNVVANLAKLLIQEYVI